MNRRLFILFYSELAKKDTEVEKLCKSMPNERMNENII